VSEDALDLLAFEEPVRTFRSLSIGTCGTCIHLPFCRARFRIRFSVVSSRLIRRSSISAPVVRPRRRDHHLLLPL
jgi:hypothetical protein